MGTRNLSIADNVTFGCQKVSLIALSINNFIEYFCFVYFQDLFVCMLKNIFEEYKFFPQFPEKELRITGQLFGGIIEHGLVT